MMYKICNSICEVPENPLIKNDRKTIVTNRLFKIQSSTRIYKNSFFPRTIGDWNRLPARITDCQTIEGFRTEVGSLSVSQ